MTPGAAAHVVVAAGAVCWREVDGEVRVLRAGDTVWCPPGERHWHGAAPDSYMVHTAISLGQTVWADPVADEEYAQTPIDGEDTSDVR